MDSILEIAKDIQARQPELSLDECINIAADYCHEMQGDFDCEDIEQEAFEY